MSSAIGFPVTSRATNFPRLGASVRGIMLERFRIHQFYQTKTAFRGLLAAS
jgi:hypothetical protein